MSYELGFDEDGKVNEVSIITHPIHGKPFEGLSLSEHQKRMIEEYGEPNLVEIRIAPFDLNDALLSMLIPENVKLRNRIWWDSLTPEEKIRRAWLSNRREYWEPIRRRLAEQRAAALEVTLIAMVGRRHWVWLRDRIEEAVYVDY